MSNQVPADWIVSSLADISKFRRGSFPQPYGNPEWFDDNGFPFVQVFDLGFGNLLKASTKVRISDLAAKKSVFVPKGTVLVSIQGSIGRVVVTQYDAYVDRTILIFEEIASHIDRDFFALMVREIFSVKKNEADGGVILTITKETLKNFLMVLPPLPEQQKIAAILTSVDEVVEKTQAQIDKLKDLKNGMMQELLTKGVGIKQGGKYVPHTEFKDSPVGRIPKSWEVLDLDQIAKVIDCKHATPQYFSDGYPVVKPGNIKEGNLNVDSCAFTDKAGFDNLNENHTPKVGDIIYSRNQTYGIGAYVDREIDFCIGQDVCIIHPITCDSKFTYYVLNSPLVKLQVEFLAAGSTFKRINLGAIRKLKLQLPPIEEQLKIASIFESIDKKIVTISVKLKALQNTKKALMQDLLTGKVRVKVDNHLVV